MNKLSIFSLIMAAALFRVEAQNCPTCGGLGANGLSADHTGPFLRVSLGAAQYGQSAGSLVFDSALPNPALYTPAALQFTAPTRTDVAVITNLDGSLRQVNAPQALADIPVPPTTNGYVINFYYASQVTGLSGGLYQFSGAPYVTWMITNSNPSTINQIQISESSAVYGLVKQWNFTYTPGTGVWSAQSLGGAVQENRTLTNLNANTYQIIDTMQSPSGPVVQQVKKTYQVLSWYAGTNVVLVQTAVGSDSAPEITTYTYPSSPNAGNKILVQTITNADGSQIYYNAYDNYGRPTDVYSTFGDSIYGRETQYVYNPNQIGGMSAYGDNGTLHTNTPRQVMESVNGAWASCQYTVFPSAGVRLDIQWAGDTAYPTLNDPNNLVTTNLFYTSGPNQFALQAVIRPDQTMTTYNYATNAAGTLRTNITATGQPDPAYGYIVDGVSNQTVLNQFGYNVSSISWDIKSGIPLSRDVYGNFDSYGRPQQVTHLDNTTEYMQYACCGMDNTIDRDGVVTQYLYDPANRQVGYEKIYNGTPISFTNVLDAAGRVLQSIRIGSDNSPIILGQSAYDLAGELIAQTNALGGVTTYSRTSDPVTGGLIRTTVNPDGGTRIDTYYADGSLKSVTGTDVHGKAYGYGVGTDVIGINCTYVVETNLNTDGSLSSEWTETFRDKAGRTAEILKSSPYEWMPDYSQYYYNNEGQLTNYIDPDQYYCDAQGYFGEYPYVSTLYAYNGKGELAYTVIDTNQNNTIDFGGGDRITWTTNDVTTDNGTYVSRTRIYVWDTLNANSPKLVSTSETSTDGLNTWQTTFRDANTPVTTHSQTVPGTSRVVTTTAPDNSFIRNTYSYGQLVSTTCYDSTGAQIGSTTYTYDAHGRQSTVTDARDGATTYGYNNADLVTSVTTPNPGGIGGPAQTTTTTYNTMLQAITVVQPDGSSVNNVYLLTGELGLTYGSRTYPVGYSYDYAGRVQTMTNWSNFTGGSGARVTTWTYDPYLGFLTGKTYPDGTGPTYTYSFAGRLLTRTWARTAGGQPLVTTYGYDNAGALISVNYSDSTPGVTNAYDRLGRLSTVVRNGMTDTLTYNLASELLTESWSGGPLNGLSVTNGYDQCLRRTNLTALASGVLNRASYTYDNASRLSTVTDGNNNSAAYGYLANSPLAGRIQFKQNTTTRLTTSKQYDYLNRLTSISSSPGASGVLPISFNYNYNTANQRTRDTLGDDSYWIYNYDSLGQVTGGSKYWADGTPVAGQQFDYTFDTIGNRTQTQSGGDQNGMNLRTANYSANNLNQITSRDVPGYVDVKGVSLAASTVTVNGQAAYRRVEYFRAELPVNNSSLALWTSIAVSATGQGSVSGSVFVPQTPEQFLYDLDGNLTNDGRWSYQWDAENRLTNMTSLATAPAGSKLKLDFAYDANGRRIQKIVSTNNGSIYVAQYTNRFVYDGWNLIAILKPQSSILESFMWGNDLSGRPQGAGGVGGLLEVSYYGSATTNCFAAYDGNGNVAALVNTADGTIVANYEYGPFGEVIRATGPMAKVNPLRFSTIYQDDESDLLMYVHRPYKPSTGTWLSRDPLNTLVDDDARVDFLEESGLSEETAFSITTQPQESTDYIFVNNCSISQWDYLGLILTPNCYTVSVTGTFTRVNEIWHKLGHPGNHLTYTACCPSCAHLGGLNLTSSTPIWAPSTEPFANWTSWAQVTPMSPGNCEQIVIAVPWRSVIKNGQAAISAIKLQYSCCSYQALPMP